MPRHQVVHKRSRRPREILGLCTLRGQVDWCSGPAKSINGLDGVHRVDRDGRYPEVTSDALGDLTVLRHAVIATSPELRERERERAKLADYADAVAGALRAKGVGARRRSRQSSASALRVAIERWAGGEDTRDLCVVSAAEVATLRHRRSGVTAGVRRRAASR